MHLRIRHTDGRMGGQTGGRTDVPGVQDSAGPEQGVISHSLLVGNPYSLPVGLESPAQSGSGPNWGPQIGPPKFGIQFGLFGL